MDSEILAIIADGGTTSVLDKDAAVNVVTWDTDQWVSYDDETTIKMKKDYANGKCLGGTNGMGGFCIYQQWISESRAFGDERPYQEESFRRSNPSGFIALTVRLGRM